jgi:hypothetical protein
VQVPDERMRDLSEALIVSPIEARQHGARELVVGQVPGGGHRRLALSSFVRSIAQS